ncbi:integrase core domain-containing protein [Amycolatopsis sp. TRM77291]
MPCTPRAFGVHRINWRRARQRTAESIIGLFKTELVNRHGPFTTLPEAEYAVMGWADWYNNDRLHSHLDYLALVEYKNTHYVQQPPRRPALV